MDLSNQQLMVILGIAFPCDLANIIGNIVITLIIFKDNRFKSTPAKLLVNQPIADACVGIVSIIYIIFLLFNSETDTVVTTLRTCVFIFYCESMQTLGAQSLTLWFAICYPVKFKIHNTIEKIYGFIAGSWLLNIAVALLLTVADESYVHSYTFLFSFHRHSLSGMWYEILRFLMMFLAPMIGVVAFIKVRMYKHQTAGSSFQLSAATKQLVDQSLSIPLVSSIYLLAFLIQILGDNVIPRTADYAFLIFVMTYVVYLHLILKLPVFLVLFKNYRKVARRICCTRRHRVDVQPAGDRVRTVTTST